MAGCLNDLNEHFNDLDASQTQDNPGQSGISFVEQFHKARHTNVIDSCHLNSDGFDRRISLRLMDLAVDQ
jgi:hypothetical protein